MSRVGIIRIISLLIILAAGGHSLAAEAPAPRLEPAVAAYQADDEQKLRREREKIPGLLEDLKSKSRGYPDDHDVVQEARRKLAVTYRKLQDWRRSLHYYELIAIAYAKTRNPSDTVLLKAKVDVARALDRGGDQKKSIRLYQDALDRLTDRLDPTDKYLISLQESVAILKHQLADYQGSYVLYKQLYEYAKERYPDRHPDLLRWSNGYGACCVELGKNEEAQRVLEAAVRGYEQSEGDENKEDLVLARNNLALAYVNLGEIGKAEPIQKKLLEESARDYPPDHYTNLLARINYATTLFSLKRLDEAKKLVDEQIRLCSRDRKKFRTELGVAKTLLRDIKRALADSD